MKAVFGLVEAFTHSQLYTVYGISIHTGKVGWKES